MGLVAFVFVVVPWMALAVWLFRPAGAVRLGTPAAPWRALTTIPIRRVIMRSCQELCSTAASDYRARSSEPCAYRVIIGPDHQNKTEFLN